MKFGNYLYANAKWTFNKNCFEGLLAIPTTQTQLIEQLKGLSNRYYPERAQIQTVNTEFCLNQIALIPAKTQIMKIAKEPFEKIWQDFLRLKDIFRQQNLQFNSSRATRIEEIATLIAKCTGFCLDENQLQGILHKAGYLLDLTEMERQYLPLAVELAKINYYCALSLKVLGGKIQYQKRLANFCQRQLLAEEFEPNTHYRQGVFRTQHLTAVCDCMGQSAVSLENLSANTHLKTYLYKNNRNFFDTFCSSKIGAHTAEFFSQTATVEVRERYFLTTLGEVRKITLTNKGKGTNCYLWENVLEGAGDYFTSAGALCIATPSTYVAVVMVKDNEIVGEAYQKSLTWKIKLQPHERCQFDVVTLYSPDMPTLAQKLQEVTVFGATYCPYLTDKKQATALGQRLSLTPCSYTQRQQAEMPSKKLNFTYQLGNDDVATFVDNGGKSATLLNGFVFGTGGERVYSVKNGYVTQINCGKFTLDGRLRYDNGKSKCEIFHAKNKTISVTHDTPQKTLFYLPLERQTQVTFENNIFHLWDKKRRYALICEGKVESYTTDAIECNQTRLRYKLSNNLDAGSCLAICFEKALSVSVTICPTQATPKATPLVQESLVSTYLNYVNGKEVFCLNNNLKRPTALSLAGICYTNPQFVKQYLLRLWNNKQDTSFYDTQGNLQKSCDNLLFDLACVYYASLVKEDSFPSQQMKTYVFDHLMQDFEGKELAIKALALKKASQLEGFDKVKCLVEYTDAKKILCENARLYPFAQAIGALPLLNPSKERLKDLCNGNDVPKNWYYVSQLENLYGLTLVADSLNIAPKVSTDALEQFALNFAGKRINTTFAKGTVRAMTLNGVTCHQPFDPYSLKKVQNTLVVSY